MKTTIVIMFSALMVFACSRPANKAHVTEVARRAPETNLQRSIPQAQMQPLSYDALVGNWLRLNSEGQTMKNGDRLVLAKNGDRYIGIFESQGLKKKIFLSHTNDDYFIIAESGERYKVARIESMIPNENGGISLDLVVGPGFDDVGVGFFQREDILKELEGQ